MDKQYGSATRPLLLIHGGAGAWENIEQHRDEKNRAIEQILSEVFPLLKKGGMAIDAVSLAVKRLEENPLFNAGLGAALQDDGKARLTASIMDSARGEFSAVMGVNDIIYASELARALQGKSDRVFGALGGQQLARDLGMKPANPITAEQIEKWKARAKNPSQGTVGAVALDIHGNLAACTSTGGKGQSAPDRLPDVGTVAGNYASKFAAISCTGIGEQIVDDAAAARIETRVRDGISLIDASERQFAEATARKHLYGWIALDSNANWVAYFTTDSMSAGIMSLEDLSLF